MLSISYLKGIVISMLVLLQMLLNSNLLEPEKIWNPGKKVKRKKVTEKKSRWKKSPMNKSHKEKSHKEKNHKEKSHMEIKSQE